MTIKTAPLPPDAKMRMIPSYLGYLGIIGCFVAPKETYVSVDMTMKVMQLVYGLFFTLFMFMPAMFFKDNFVKAPKDNFGELFMVMFGFQGFAQLYLIRMADPYGAFPVVCALNAGMCYIGPQRGEKLNSPNVKPFHIVPHASLFLCSAMALATLL